METDLVKKDQIINTLQTDYGIQVSTLSRLPFGADHEASVYKGVSPDQTAYFIKLKKGKHDISADILELLQKAEVRQVISPIKTQKGHSSLPIEGQTLTVYPFVEGEDGFSCDLSDEQWRQLGKALRQLHELKVPEPLHERIPKETFSSKWRDAVRLILPHLETDRFANPLAQKMQARMKKHLPDIQRLLKGADVLGGRLRDSPPRFVLCHSDIHAGNVLLDDEAHLYIVDWDEPLMAPKERDLMFIGGGVGNVWNRPRESALFYEGYGDVVIDQVSLAYYRCNRILEDLAIYGKEILLSPNAGKKHHEMLSHFETQFESGGVVEIALNTISTTI